MERKGIQPQMNADQRRWDGDLTEGHEGNEGRIWEGKGKPLIDTNQARMERKGIQPQMNADQRRWDGDLTEGHEGNEGRSFNHR
jgi:hypothetical protein